MNCPVDMTDLQEATYEGIIEVEICPSCKGMWLEYGELEAIQELKVEDYREELAKIPTYFDQSGDFALAMDEAACDCPSCGREMEKREFVHCSRITMDVCPSCRGVWLFDDEIKELEKYFEHCGIDPAKIRLGFLRGLFSFFN